MLEEELTQALDSGCLVSALADRLEHELKVEASEERASDEQMFLELTRASLLVVQWRWRLCSVRVTGTRGALVEHAAHGGGGGGGGIPENANVVVGLPLPFVPHQHPRGGRDVGPVWDVL